MLVPCNQIAFDLSDLCSKDEKLLDKLIAAQIAQGDMYCLKDGRTQYGWYNPVGLFKGGYETPEEENKRIFTIFKQVKESKILPGIHNELTIMEMMRHNSVVESEKAQKLQPVSEIEEENKGQ